MQLKKPPDHRSAPMNLSRAYRMLISSRPCCRHSGIAKQALQHALHFEKILLIAARVVQRGDNMRDLIRKTGAGFRMNLMPDFENPKLRKMPHIADDVFVDTRQQAAPQMRQLRCNG